MKIGYVRVSDDHQNDQMQIDALRAAGCAVIYGDHGVSGSVTARKGLDALLQDLSAGDTLMVWKLDRLGRSTVHLLLLLDKLRQRHVDFVSLTQGIDTTTAIGRMVFGQLAVFAEFEREQIRDCMGRIETALGHLRPLRSAVTGIEKETGAVRKHAGELEGEIRRALVDIATALTAA